MSFCLYNKKNITRRLEDMNFIFSWQKQYFIHSLRSFVKYCFCHSKIKCISSRHRVISSLSLYIYINKTPLMQARHISWASRAIMAFARLFSHKIMAANDWKTLGSRSLQISLSSPSTPFTFLA